MIADYTEIKALDVTLLGIPQQLSHYLSELKSKRARNHHHYAVSVHQLKNWIAKIESLNPAQKAALAKVNPVWTENELASLRDSLIRIDAAIHPYIASCLRDGCWSLIELDKLQLSPDQLASIVAALEKELGNA